MTIGFPYLVYGYVYDSNGHVAVSGTVIVEADSDVTDDITSIGRYRMDIQDYASSGDTVTLRCEYSGERHLSSFKVITAAPGKRTDITLQEAFNPNDFYINTHHRYDNELYIFTPYNEESWCKTSDY